MNSAPTLIYKALLINFPPSIKYEFFKEFLKKNVNLHKLLKQRIFFPTIQTAKLDARVKLENCINFYKFFFFLKNKNTLISG